MSQFEMLYTHYYLIHHYEAFLLSFAQCSLTLHCFKKSTQNGVNGFLKNRAPGRYPKPVNRNDRLHANSFFLCPEHRFVQIADIGSADGVIVDVAFLTMFL